MLRLLLLLSIVPVFLGLAPETVAAQEKAVVRTVPQLAGEDYLYAIDFLVFTKLAAGELRFSATEKPNIYRAELVGRTLGIASWLTGDRTQIYTSLMALSEDGTLRSIEHVATIVKRRWGKWQKRGRYHRYDYVRRRVVDEKSKDGLFRSRKVHEIPEGRFPVDMLTAFYNLRAGVYGTLEHGSSFDIPTYSDRGFTEIKIRVLTVEQQAEHPYFPEHGLLVQATIDPEIFETKSGHVYIWFDDAGIPVRGIVEDLIGLGDVQGYLDKGSL